MYIERKDILALPQSLVCKERDYYALNCLYYRNFDSGSSPSTVFFELNFKGDKKSKKLFFLI